MNSLMEARKLLDPDMSALTMLGNAIHVNANKKKKKKKKKKTHYLCSGASLPASYGT